MSDEVAIDSRAGSIQPIEPDWKATVEKYLWWGVWTGAMTAVLALGETIGVWNLTDPDASLSWIGGGIVWAIGLVGVKVGKWIVAYRRYGYTPSEYRVAKRRARGRALTPDEAAEKHIQWQQERAESIVGEMNQLKEKLEGLSEVDAEVEYDGGRFYLERESDE